MLLAESLLGSSSAGESVFIEDVFSTWLYTGNGSTQTITNGIDLAGKGGLVWVKRRDADNHRLVDTARGVNWALQSNTTSGQDNSFQSVTAFNSNGFTVGSGSAVNAGASPIASWTFREQPKFFDVVTFTTGGTLSSNRSISHNLGSAPGFIVVKSSSNDSNWLCYHRSLGQSSYVALQSTNAQNTSNLWWTATAPTSTTFNIDETLLLNTNRTYVAYLFAHNAGGFGATGADNVISCGSFTTDADGFATVNLGYEPQWVLMKRTDSTGSWTIFDNMRGWSSSQAQLFPNNSNAEGVGGPLEILQATGFATKAFSFASNATNIYIAIRRGPMRTPTSGTSVFSPIASSAATGTALTTGFPVDAQIFSLRTGTTNKNNTYDRLRGVSSTTTESGARLITSSTAAETAAGNETRLWDNTGFQMPSTFGGASTVFWNFRRAPGFFDVVCYTGTGATTQTTNHNLGVVPELIISKCRSNADGWIVGSSFGVSTYNRMTLNSTGAATSFSYGSGNMFSDAPTASALVWDAQQASGRTYLTYLFASAPGVSKVGSFTGTGATQTINCGFSSGARFVLIKRTDSTGDWYVWDSARGIVAGNDPYLLLNSTAAEVTNTDWVDTAASGFELSNSGGNLVNINGASYIFLSVS